MAVSLFRRPIEVVRFYQLMGGKSYTTITASTSSSKPNPYSILIFGYQSACIVSSVYSEQPLSSLIKLVTDGGGPGVSLSNGIITCGSDSNRQFVAICPEGVALEEVTS